MEFNVFSVFLILGKNNTGTHFCKFQNVCFKQLRLDSHVMLGILPDTIVINHLGQLRRKLKFLSEPDVQNLVKRKLLLG